MLLQLNHLSVALVLQCLYTFVTISSAELDARKSGCSIEAVKVARTQVRNQLDITRRGNEQTAVELDSQWLLPVQIGTPPQSFLMTPDSGAPSLVVESVFLPKNGTRNTDTYDPSKSSTASQLAGYTYSNCFGSGHCGNGVVYNDTVTVGNISVNMAFEVSVSTNGVSDGSTTNSGNFGLSFAPGGMTTSPKKLPTWLQTVLPLCPQQVFTMDFNGTSSTGTIDFGYIDNSKYQGNIGYTPVQSADGFWGITFSGFQVGSGSNAIFNNSQSWKAIVDSGTSTTAWPKFVVDGYFQNISGAVYDSVSATYRFPCSTVLPDFVFGIAGDTTYRGVIPLQSRNAQNGMCVTKLAVGTGTVIFGQDFIESQFVIFDFGNARIGFANKGLPNTGSTNAAPNGTSSTTPNSSSHTSSSTSVSSTSSATVRNNSSRVRRLPHFSILLALVGIFISL